MARDLDRVRALMLKQDVAEFTANHRRLRASLERAGEALRQYGIEAKLAMSRDELPTWPPRADPRTTGEA